MKKTLLLIALSFAYTLTSCTGDDGNNSPVTGTWKYIGSYEGSNFYINIPECYHQILHFNEDLSGLHELDFCDDYYDKSDFNWAETSEGNYDIIYPPLEETNEFFVSSTFSIENDTLKVEGENNFKYAYVRQ